jgi:carbohydrate-selective porin OprB
LPATKNSTFCGSDPGNLVGNHILNWPVSQWVTDFKVCLHGSDYAQIGADDVNPRYLDTDVEHALAPAFFSGSTCVLLPIEVGWAAPVFRRHASGQFTSLVDGSAHRRQLMWWTAVAPLLPLIPMDLSKVDGRFGAYLKLPAEGNSTINSRGGLSLFLGG